MKRNGGDTLVNMAAPTLSAYGGSLYVTTLPIPHGLGFNPQYRYSYEPFGDGVIWPQLVSRLGGFAINPNNHAQDGPGIIAWVDETNLYLQLFYFNNTLTGTYPVYYNTYRDFAL